MQKNSSVCIQCYGLTNAVFKIVVIIIGTLYLFACQLSKPSHLNKLQQRDSIISGSKCNVVWLNEKKLSKHISDNELKTSGLQCKADITLQSESSQHELDVKIRWIPDSSMFLQIQYLLGIDIAKLWISRDSVVMVNYIEKTYLREDVSELNRWFNTELDFDLLQALLFGNSAAFNEDEKRLHAFVNRDSCTYMLSTERKRKWKKINSGNINPYTFFQILTVNHINFKIVKNEIQDPKTQRSLKIGYSNFKTMGYNFAPQHVDIEVNAPQVLHIKIDYVRMEPLESHLKAVSVPKGYDRIYPKTQQ
jgi:hypothetical protein